MTKKNEIAARVAVALTGVETDVAVPSRTHASSFASTLVSMSVGAAPACRALLVDASAAPAFADAVTLTKERLRDGVQSSINQAKRRLPGSAYSIECVAMVSQEGPMVVALVRRTA